MAKNCCLLQGHPTQQAQETRTTLLSAYYLRSYIAVHCPHQPPTGLITQFRWLGRYCHPGATSSICHRTVNKNYNCSLYLVFPGGPLNKYWLHYWSLRVDHLTTDFACRCLTVLVGRQTVISGWVDTVTHAAHIFPAFKFGNAPKQSCETVTHNRFL